MSHNEQGGKPTIELEKSYSAKPVIKIGDPGPL